MGHEVWASFSWDRDKGQLDLGDVIQGGEIICFDERNQILRA